MLRVVVGAAAESFVLLHWRNSCMVLFLMSEVGVLRCELLLLMSFLPDWHDREALFSLSLAVMVFPGVRHYSIYYFYCNFGVILSCYMS